MAEQANNSTGEHETAEDLAASESVARDRVTVFERLVDWFVETDPWQVRSYVHDLRDRYPDASDAELSRKVVSLKSLKNGFVGAAAGTPGFLAFPIVVPADVIVSWKIQINMAMCIAHIHGQAIDTQDLDADIKTDISLILAGNSAKDCLRILGIDVDAVTKKTVKRYVTREVTMELCKHLARKIISVAGVRTFSRMSRLVPLVGAPIGFAFDYSAARSVGECACDYYRPTDKPVAVETVENAS